MFRDRTIWLIMGLLLGSSLACNAFAGPSEPALELPPPPTTVSEATPLADGGGQVTDIAPTATLAVEVGNESTDVPNGQAVLTILVDLNVRRGPGVQYDRVGFMLKGESAAILGRDPATGWWKIECPSRANSLECWVSGGVQYTAGDNTEGVPIAAVPPTPTPEPTATPEEGGFRVVSGAVVVYGGNRGLWTMALDATQDPPTASAPDLLVASADEIIPFISPDGRKVAYLASQSGENVVLRVVNMDGSNDRLLLDSTDLPVAVESSTSSLTAQVDNVQWLADSQAVAFNSYFRNLEGAGSQEDLWTVSLDGTVRQRFAAGEGGGRFAISLNNQIILGQRRGIIRANLDGSGQETVIDFDLVNTASEFIYYPQAQWTADGNTAYVAIPSPQQYAPGAAATLWRIGRNGPAELLQSVPGIMLFNPVSWSANGSSLAYIQQLPDHPEMSPVLILADGNGQELQDYVTGEQLAFHQWSPDGSHFLYSGQGYYAIGRSGAAASEIPIPEDVADVRWITNSAFVAVTGQGYTWHISSGNLSGETEILVTAAGSPVRIDVWAP